MAVLSKCKTNFKNLITILFIIAQHSSKTDCIFLWHIILREGSTVIKTLGKKMIQQLHAYYNAK